ncbi:hypothetical protein HWV62_44518 [Athelia sp. TMB]|nr:hypothetical protein HWV62_44518 [Athelia sp. TMB]
MSSATRRGPKGNFQGIKLAFLMSLGPLFVQWRAEGRSGEFYDHAARLFMRRFGMWLAHQSFYLDPLKDPGDPGEDVADAGCASQAEADTYKTQYDLVRATFTNWFRNHFPSEKVASTKNSAPCKKSAAVFTDAGPLSKLLGSGKKAPHRRSAFSIYQQKHFGTRVSPEYERRWALELSKYKSYTPQERLDKSIEKPISVRLMTKTCAEFWANESLEFKASVQAYADDWHKQALARWELGLKTPKTPLDYHHQLMAISQHLQPIVDAIAAQTGSDAVLFLVGPIPMMQGQLEARSISATRPGRSTGRGWVADDPAGVTYTEQRLVEYAKGHFTNAECAMRALPAGFEIEDSEDDLLGDLDQIDQQGDDDEGASEQLIPSIQARSIAAQKEVDDIEAGISLGDADALPSPAPSTTVPPVPVPQAAVSAPPVVVTPPPPHVAPLPPSLVPASSVPPVPTGVSGPPTPNLFAGMAQALGNSAPPVNIVQQTVITLPARLPATIPSIIATAPIPPPTPLATPPLAAPVPSQSISQPILLTENVSQAGVSIPVSPSYDDETPIPKVWPTMGEAASDLPIEPDALPTLASDDTEDLTLEQLMRSVAPPPFKRHKTGAGAPTGVPKTVCAPGVIPGRRDRPSAIPHLIAQTLLPASQTPKTVSPLSLLPNAASPPANAVLPDLVPNYMKWPAYECQGFKWLVRGTETWDDWSRGIRMLMDFRDRAGFRSQKADILLSEPPTEIAEWMKSPRSQWT